MLNFSVNFPIDSDHNLSPVHFIICVMCRLFVICESNVYPSCVYLLFCVSMRTSGTRGGKKYRSLGGCGQLFGKLGIPWVTVIIELRGQKDPSLCIDVSSCVYASPPVV
jgi:hypothetical protein